jgi:hypothetical protein
MPRYKKRKRIDGEALPYGIWRLDDGVTEIMHDRAYRPMWSRRRGDPEPEPAVKMEDQWVYGIAKKEYLYDPTLGPLTRAEIKRLLEIEQEFIAGVEIMHIVRPVPVRYVRRRPAAGPDADRQHGHQHGAIRWEQHGCRRIGVIEGGKKGEDA